MDRAPVRDLDEAGALLVVEGPDQIDLPAWSTAAPPREWPMRMEGAPSSSAMKRAAATTSSTFEEKLVSAKSPLLSPRPVKSNRTTPRPRAERERVMSTASRMFFEQVKQCANSA